MIVFLSTKAKKCDDHDHSNIDGHVDILKIGGRSSVEAKVGNEGSHNFLIVVAVSVRFVQFWAIFGIPSWFWRFGVSFACVLGPFSDCCRSPRLNSGRFGPLGLAAS